MKILLISSYLPYPLTNGGHIRLYNLMRELKDKHEITLICEKRDKQTAKDVQEVEKICHKVITVPRKKQWSVGNILKSGFSNDSFLIVGHTSTQMREAIDKELLASVYDLIHVETFYVLQNIAATTLPIVLVEHNIEYQVYERYAKKSPFYLKLFLTMDIQKIKKVEKKAWQRATIVGAVSDEDKNTIGLNNTVVIPNGVDTKQFRLKNFEKSFDKKEKKILYIGDYSWVQNRDAAEYIIKEVWPKLKLQGDFSLWFVGRNMPESLKALGKGDSSIIFDDNNQMKTPEIFSEADVLLAPKRVGGGTSYKILESLAVGTPVVTTSLGLEGLELEKDKDVLVSDSLEELVKHVEDILSDEKLYRTLAENGRKQVDRHYDWQSIAEKLDEVYKSIVSKS